MNGAITGETTVKWYCAIATLQVLLLSAPTRADTPGVGTIGTGTFTCAKFGKYDSAPNNSGQMDLVVQWGWGFISAYNMRAAFSQTYQVDDAPNPVTPPDAAATLLFIRNHCEKNPQSNVMNAMLDLIGSLGGIVTSSINLAQK